jgi:glycosyltransferase involved in cell wall biosynthesis
MDNSKQEKLLFLIFQTGNRSNGGVNSVSQLLEALDHDSIKIITQQRTPCNEGWKRLGIPLEVMDIGYVMGSPFLAKGPIGLLRRISSLLSTNYHIYQVCRQERFRLLHINDPAAFWHSVFGAKMAGSRVLFNIRDTKGQGEGGFWKWKLAGQLADAILVLSEEMAAYWQKKMQLPFLRMAEGKFSRIYSIVEFQRFYKVNTDIKRKLRQQLAIRENSLALGYVATFNPKKAQLAFIEQAMPLLKQQLPDSKVYFIGDFHPETNPYARACLQEARQLDLTEHLAFIGFDEAVDRWYQALDITILASRKEGLARCMIESLACGRPVVSFDVCSAREILERHQCGLVVPQGDYPALVSSIQLLAQDQQRYQAYRENAFRASRSLFEKSQAVRQYQNLCHKLLNG